MWVKITGCHRILNYAKGLVEHGDKGEIEKRKIKQNKKVSTPQNTDYTVKTTSAQ